MICRKCHTYHEKPANYCSHCGAALRAGSGPEKRKGRAVLTFFLVLSVALAGFFVFSSARRMRDSNKHEAAKSAERHEERAGALPAPERHEIISPQTVLHEKEVQEKVTPVPIGWVVVKNRWNREVSKLPAAVVGGRWIALPFRACLGGEIWLFRPGEADEARIRGGLWRQGHPVGLWYLEEGVRFEGPLLKRWSEGELTEWLPLENHGEPRAVKIKAVRNQGLFLSCTTEEPIKEPGLFLQGERVVGWTFNPDLEEGFLWNGSETDFPNYDISVDSFYNVTFAGGREEKWCEALSMGREAPEIERLAVFAESFRFSSKLSKEDAPAYLNKASIMQHMHTLATGLIQKGSAQGVADIFTDQVIMETADAMIFLDGVHATAKAHGNRSALEMFEQWHGYIQDAVGEDIPELVRVHKHLYMARIAELLKEGEIRHARELFRYAADAFPADAGLSLLGVDAALAEDDLDAAESLLQKSEYPPDLIDKARYLQNRIRERRAEEGKIVLRFHPNSRQIPVTARLNRRVQVKFFIDTGASMVTIPSALAGEPGITIGPNPRKVTGVGGVQVAPEATISEIELEGWTVYNVKALVLDLPQQPGVGLLGLNFLELFRMELNPEKGILMLKPKL